MSALNSSSATNHMERPRQQGQLGSSVAVVEWARAGWRVFPLMPGGKQPLPGSHGFKAASNDPQVVAAMCWEFNGQPCNIGIATGDGLVVLDVDCKNGKNGCRL